MNEGAIDERQGFDRGLGLVGSPALLLVVVNGFADPALFGGGNIAFAAVRPCAVVDQLAEHVELGTNFMNGLGQGDDEDAHSLAA